MTDAQAYQTGVLIGAVIYLVVFGGLGCWISAQKNRKADEGLWLGVLFGPLGCLIAALVPTIAAPAPKTEEPQFNRVNGESDFDFELRKQLAKRRMSPR